MRRAAGWVIVVCGLALATITIGTELGYFTFLDPGEGAEPTSLKYSVESAVIYVFELFLIVLGARLILGSRKARTVYDQS
jgi:hypothetical protein